MAQEKKGIVARFLEGKEKSDDYARSTLPNNRWNLFFDIVKGRFGKVVIVNLIILATFLPLIVLAIFHASYVSAQGSLYPFGSNLGVGYPAMPDTVGFAEYLVYQSNVVFFALYIVCSLIAALGLSGGGYVIRNMLWTEGVFVANDVWKGIRKNYFPVAFACLFFTAFLYVVVILTSYADVMIALGVGNEGVIIFAKVVSYVILGYVALMALWMISCGINYKCSVWHLIRNSFILAGAMLPQNLFFAILMFLPAVFLFIGSLFSFIGVAFFALMGLSYVLLVWLDYSQWVFDKYVNPNLKGAKVGRGLYDRNAHDEYKEGSAHDDSAALEEYRLAVMRMGKSKLASRPIKPIDDDLEVYELPTSFSREDLQKLRESKETIKADCEAYAEEHKNDARYVEYNKQFDDREKALQEPEDKKGKKKKTKLGQNLLHD